MEQDHPVSLMALRPPRSGRLEEILPIELKRPREAGVKQSAAFQAYVSRIAQLIAQSA